MAIFFKNLLKNTYFQAFLAFCTIAGLILAIFSFNSSEQSIVQDGNENKAKQTGNGSQSIQQKGSGNTAFQGNNNE
jgi:hypothetical protein